MTGAGPAGLAELAGSVFGTAADGAGLDAPLWATLVETGLARLTLPEAAGGSGGTFADAAVVLAAAGAHAARVPLVETDLLGGWLLHAAGLPVPGGVLTAVATGPAAAGGSGAGGPAAAGGSGAAVAGSAARGGVGGAAAGAPVGGSVPGGGAAGTAAGGRDRSAAGAGTLHRVPWGRAAAGVAVLAGGQVLLVDPGTAEPAGGRNLADEPRDTLAGGAVLAAAPAPPGAAAELAERAALGRSLLLAGAAAGALAASVRYARVREQFGRPIGRFQAVQQQLALAAAEVAAAGAAAEAAAATADRDGFGAAATTFAVAAAKSRTGEAAGAVARIAHQVHGAVGFTREHDLRLLTTRLWAWRDEDGSEAHWNAVLGAAALAAGPDGLWPLVTGTP